jgi:hypothetical protein
MIRGKQINGELRPESERRLNEIWFIWNASEGKWDAMSRALTQFKQREGHCNVFVKHIEYLDHGGGKLNKLNPGGWLAYQRILQGRGKLDAKKAELLESLGVKWIVNFQEDLDWNFDLLLVFKEREGHVRVPAKHQESGADNLGAWLANQRLLYRPGRLELDRQKWLEVAEDVTWESRKRPKFDHDA